MQTHSLVLENVNYLTANTPSLKMIINQFD